MHPVSRVRLPASISGIAVHPDGTLIGCATSGGTVHLVDARDGRVVWSGRHAPILRRSAPLTTISFSGRGDLMCSGAENGSVLIWSSREGRRVRRVTPTNETGALTSAFSPDGGVLAIGYRTGAIVAWAVGDGRELGRMQHIAWPNQVVYDPNGSLIASAGFDKRVHVWRADDFSEVWQRTTPDMAGEVDIARMGDRMIVTGFDDRVVLLGLADGAEQGSLQHRGRVLAARFSPDGRAILTETEHKVLTLWSADSLETLVEIQLDEYAVDPHLLPSGDVVAGFGDELRVLSLTSKEST